MAKHTYRAEFHGITVTRTTARTYTFVTVSLGKPADVVRAAEEASIASDRAAAADYRAKAAAGGYTFTASNYNRSQHFVSPEDCLRYAADYDRRADGAERSLGSYDENAVHDWGWSSRRELAEANANKARDRKSVV